MLAARESNGQPRHRGHAHGIPCTCASENALKLSITTQSTNHHTLWSRPCTYCGLILANETHHDNHHPQMHGSCWNQARARRTAPGHPMGLLPHLLEGPEVASLCLADPSTLQARLMRCLDPKILRPSQDRMPISARQLLWGPARPDRRGAHGCACRLDGNLTPLLPQHAERSGRPHSPWGLRRSARTCASPERTRCMPHSRSHACLSWLHSTLTLKLCRVPLKPP